MSGEICDEYASTLKDLTFNSKPHISMLTMLAEENSKYAADIVKVIEGHLLKVKPECKLPTLYLIDSIMKNVPNVYQPLFTQNIVSNFCSVFEKVDEKIRAQMYKLRQTWADIFPNKKLYAIDVRVKQLDPAWPVLAQPPQQSSIHVNPRFLQPAASPAETKPRAAAAAVVAPPVDQELQAEEMRKQLLAKQQELCKLQRQKVELELFQMKVLVEEQKRQLVMREHQLRTQQTLPGDLQNKLTLQQLTNVAALAAVAVSQAAPSSALDRANRKGMMTTSATSIGDRILRPDLVSVGAVDTTKPVITTFVANNKTVDVNTHAKPGIANVFQTSKNEFVPSSSSSSLTPSSNIVSVQKSSQEKSNFSSASSASKSTVANVAQKAGKSSLASILVRSAAAAQAAANDPRLRGGRDGGRSAPVGGLSSSGQQQQLSQTAKSNLKSHVAQKNVSKPIPKKFLFDKSDSSPNANTKSIGGGNQGGGNSDSNSKKRTQSPKKGKNTKLEGGGSSSKIGVGVNKKSNKDGNMSIGAAAKREGKGGGGEQSSPSKMSSPSSKMSANKDKGGGRARRSGSPIRGEGQQQMGGRNINKGSRFPPSGALLREGHRSSHSRSRSPSYVEKSRNDRGNAPAGAVPAGTASSGTTNNKRSPRKEKENDRRAADGGHNQSPFRDVDLRTASPSSASRAGTSGNVDGSGKVAQKHGLESCGAQEVAPEDENGASVGVKQSDDEPPIKKSKGSDDSELDEIFGGKDQDYRQLMRPVPKLSPIGNEHQGWAQYKASRPDEFKHAPLRPRDNVADPFGFGRHDLDLRQGGSMPGTPSTSSSSGPPTPRLASSGPFSPGAAVRDAMSRDPRNSNRGRINYGGSPGSRFPPTVTGRADPRSRGGTPYQRRESDQSIPRALLMFDRGADIMRQADMQLRSGVMTNEEHREIMEQLAKLFELQRMRQGQQRTGDAVARHPQQHQQQQQRMAEVPSSSGGGVGDGNQQQPPHRFRNYPREEPDTVAVSSDSLSDDDMEDVDERRRAMPRQRSPKIRNKKSGDATDSSSASQPPTPIRGKFLKPSEADDDDQMAVVAGSSPPTEVVGDEPTTTECPDEKTAISDDNSAVNIQVDNSDVDVRTASMDRDERRDEPVIHPCSLLPPKPQREVAIEIDVDEKTPPVAVSEPVVVEADQDLRILDDQLVARVRVPEPILVPTVSIEPEIIVGGDGGGGGMLVTTERLPVRKPPRRSPPPIAEVNCQTGNTVMIDDKPRQVLFYGEHSIVLLGEADDDPRLIAFRGPPQDVTFDSDDDKCVVRLGFGPRDFKEFELAGNRHTLRFGAPTRELLIDGQPYSAIFGGPPFIATLHGIPYRVRLLGPTPEVHFGEETRHDLLAHIRAEGNFPADLARPPLHPLPQPAIGDENRDDDSPVRWVTSTIGRDYDPREWTQDTLDDESNRFGSRPPSFGRGGRGGGGGGPDWNRNNPRFQHENMPYRHERGGRASFRGNDRRGGRIVHHHANREFREFEPWAGHGRGGGNVEEQPMRPDDYHGTLPRGGGLPGRLHRDSGRRNSPVMDEFYEQQRHSPYSDAPPDGRPPNNNYYPDARFGGPSGGPVRPPSSGMPPHNRFDVPGVRMGGGGAAGGPMPPRPMGHHPPMPQGFTGRFTGPPPPYGFPVGAPPNANFPLPPAFGYPGGPPPMMPGMNPPGFPQMPIPPQIDVNSLFEKLVATGIVAAPQVPTIPERPEDQNSNDAAPEVPATKTPPEVVIPTIPFTNEGLRSKYPGVVASLYFGIQCSSCGVRFTSEQTEKYAQHLDWHFRQNRREKDSVRKALSRKWHYIMQDWIQFEEIEDLEERARSFFELQANEAQGEDGEDVNSSVAAGENEEDKNCVVCHELFELYWDEEHEEWHFRDCCRHDEKNYHPLCYEDYKEQVIKAAVEEEKARIQAENDRLAALREQEEWAAAALIKQEAADAAEEAKAVEDEAMETATDELTIKRESGSEPMDTTLPDEPLDSMDVQEISVFNVLASSYSVPPLIGLDTEETEEATPIQPDDIKTESDNNAESAEPGSDEATANPIKEESSLNSTTTTNDDDDATKQKHSLEAVEQDENDLCAATRSIAIKQEPVEHDESDLCAVGDADDECLSIAATVVERLVSAVCGESVLSIVDETVARECLDDPLHGEIVEKITWGTTDVLLAEPSSCSGGEQSDGGPTAGGPSDQAGFHEDTSDESDSGEPRIVNGFTVLRPVNIGTELSGLCTIL